jgi:hypothetical protein
MAFGFASSAYAFHSGGVAECEGCHTMHNSLESQRMTVDDTIAVGAGNPYLMQGTDQSSTCLNCHQHEGDTGPSSYHISTHENDMPAGVAPIQRTPGGDFGWLKKTYTWTPRAGATPETSDGERHGHSIVAVDFGYSEDITNQQAPGGTYPAGYLSCISCHDPHGKYRRDATGGISTTGLPIKNSGSYGTSADPTAWAAVGAFRILGGVGYNPKSIQNWPFTEDVPAAVAPGSYNRTEATTQTRVAYGKGMSEWCANCHPDMHTDSYTSGLGGAGTRHPAGDGSKLGTTFSANYNSYVKSGDLSGVSASSYNSLIPFEEGVADHTLASYSQIKLNAVNNDTKLAGPDATNANVSCMSCHRAHASGFDSMLRYNLGNEFMTVADATGTPVYPDPVANASQAQGRQIVETQAAYYDRPATKFAPYQRVLCNKCHVKD